jgi:hypothetical protein
VDWLWTCGGRSFGYREGDSLWTRAGRNVGRFVGSEVFGPDGRYLGEMLGSSRLITCRSKIAFSNVGFTPLAVRTFCLFHPDYSAYPMAAGTKTFRRRKRSTSKATSCPGAGPK